jgi:hypothetical protein
MNNYLYTRLYGLKGIYYWLYFKLVLLFVMLICQVRNWRNISPHANFLIIFLYDGFFLIFKVQEIVFLYS